MRAAVSRTQGSVCRGGIYSTHRGIAVISRPTESSCEGWLDFFKSWSSVRVCWLKFSNGCRLSGLLYYLQFSLVFGLLRAFFALSRLSREGHSTPRFVLKNRPRKRRTGKRKRRTGKRKRGSCEVVRYIGFLYILCPEESKTGNKRVLISSIVRGKKSSRRRRRTAVRLCETHLVVPTQRRRGGGRSDVSHALDVRPLATLHREDRTLGVREGGGGIMISRTSQVVPPNAHTHEDERNETRNLQCSAPNREQWHQQPRPLVCRRQLRLFLPADGELRHPGGGQERLRAGDGRRPGDAEGLVWTVPGARGRARQGYICQASSGSSPSSICWWWWWW